MKRSLALLLALALLLPAGLVSAAAEGAHTFSPTVSPGLTQTETTVDTGIPGLTLTIGADEWSQSEVDIPIVSASGVAYTGYLVGKANPKPAEGTGTYFSFTLDHTVGTGSLEIMYRLNAGKGFYILDNGQAMEGFDGMKLDVAADTSTTLIVEGGHTYTVYASGSKLRLYGCTFQNVDPAVVFAAEIAAFPFARIQGENPDAGHVDADLALMDSYESQFGSCDVSWTSSAPTVLDVDGTVNCQKTETVVELTGHFSVQENRALAAEVTFPVTVLADPDDASAVAVAKAALTLGDTSAVKRDLELPAVGKRGAAITWASSNDSVVDAEGRVYPAANQDQTATLTATLTRGEASETKDFTVTVAGIVPVTLDAWVYGDGEGQRRFTPVDGGALLAVNLTCNDPNPDPDDRAVLTVYGPDGVQKEVFSLPLTDLRAAAVPVGETGAYVVGLSMDAGDYFELSAQNTATGEALITPVRADDALAEGATLYVVGDSTASVYGDDRYPRKGWAQMLGSYFDGVEVVDLALSGRSSSSFKSEANYATLKTSLKKGDYLIIQFGHNDNKADAYTDPDPALTYWDEGSYPQSMAEYVELAWEKGAHPVIATSISRRKLSDEALEEYVAAARALADELSVPCIDLYAATNGYINEVGVEAAQDLFNCVKPHDSRFLDYPPFAGSEFYEKGSSDDTHLNLYGADLIAQWAVDAMVELGLPLAEQVNDYRALWPLPSYAEATEGASVAGFADVSAEDWFADSVKWAAENNILIGGGDGLFRPGDTVTRAMVVTVLWRMAGSPVSTAQSGAEASSRSDYPDVEQDAWYAEAVAWATEQGVVNGYADGSFAPNHFITREQLALMLYRWAGSPQVDGAMGMAGFADVDTLSPWAATATQWAVLNGMITGKASSVPDAEGDFGVVLDPQGGATRAELATILQRYLTAQGK